MLHAMTKSRLIMWGPDPKADDGLPLAMIEVIETAPQTPLPFTMNPTLTAWDIPFTVHPITREDVRDAYELGLAGDAS